MKDSNSVSVLLTHDQALVLFEWLYREDGKHAIPIEHRSELLVLWSIEGQLEKVLVEPLQPEYLEILAAARERIIAQAET